MGRGIEGDKGTRDARCRSPKAGKGAADPDGTAKSRRLLAFPPAGRQGSMPQPSRSRHPQQGKGVVCGYDSLIHR